MGKCLSDSRSGCKSDESKIILWSTSKLPILYKNKLIINSVYLIKYRTNENRISQSRAHSIMCKLKILLSTMRKFDLKKFI